MTMQTTSPDLPLPRAAAVPSRSRWLRRAAVAGITLVLVMGAVRWWWGAYARRVLDAEIRRLEAAGEPTYLEQLLPTPVPDAENAAEIVKRASSLIQLSPEQRAACRDALRDLRNWPGSDTSTLPGIVNAKADARRLVRIARSAPAVDWRSGQMTSGALLAAGTGLLPEVLMVAAIVTGEAGDVRESVETLRDLIALGRICGAGRSEFALLLQADLSNHAASVVEHLLKQPSFVAALQEIGADEQPGSPIADLISDLLDEVSIRTSFVTALRADICWKLTVIRKVENGGHVIQPMPKMLSLGSHAPQKLELAWAWLTLPALQLDCARWLRVQSTYLRAVTIGKTASLGEAQISPAPRSRSLPLEEPFTNLQVSREYVERPWVTAITRTRMAAVALACTLHAGQHGQLPKGLEDLVPTYLAADAIGDPCSTGGRQFGYAPDAPYPHLITSGDLDKYISRFYLKGKPPRATGTASGRSNSAPAN